MDNQIIFNQGDDVKLNITLNINGDQIKDISNISIVEFAFGDIVKSYPDEVAFNPDNQYFVVPFSQKESFMMKEEIGVQVRVKFTDNSVIGTPIYKYIVRRSISKDVI